MKSQQQKSNLNVVVSFITKLDSCRLPHNAIHMPMIKLNSSEEYIRRRGNEGRKEARKGETPRYGLMSFARILSVLCSCMNRLTTFLYYLQG